MKLDLNSSTLPANNKFQIYPEMHVILSIPILISITQGPLTPQEGG